MRWCMQRTSGEILREFACRDLRDERGKNDAETWGMSSDMEDMILSTRSMHYAATANDSSEQGFFA